MAFTPYQTQHLHLHLQLEKPQLELEHAGYYLVFWWKELPLGHLFIKPKEQLSQHLYLDRVTKALRPALSHYAGPALATVPWEQWLQQEDIENWNHWLEEVTLPWLHHPVPARVPVSVVICTRNRAATLEKCLYSLKAMPCQPEEIIVIDNAPSDSSTRQVTDTFEEVHYYLEPSPGLSYARNTGVQKATQPLLAFTDDDVLVHPHWLYRLWQSFQEPAVVAMTGLVIASELRTETQLIFEQHWSFNRGYQDVVYDQAYFQRTLKQGPPVWHIGAGANMAFRTAIFKEVGLFDERLGAGASGCSEDSEMWYRILARGYSIHYNPRSVTYHEHRDSLKALHHQLFSYMKGFAVAALIQQEQVPEARYKRHLFWGLPRYYTMLLKKGFPFYRFRYRTLATEVMGLIAGMFYYLKYRNRPAQSKEANL